MPKDEQGIVKFLTKSISELLVDPNIEYTIEKLLSDDVLVEYGDASRNKIYSKIREVEKELGNTVNKSDRLFRVTANSSRDFHKEWAELFNPKNKERALNGAITDFILKHNNFLGEKIREFNKDITGICKSFTNVVERLKPSNKIEDTNDFDYLLSLADCDKNELNNQNLKKFLNDELHQELLEETNEEKRIEKQKLIDTFSLIRYLVEEVIILQTSNITSKFFSQYKVELPTGYYLAYCIETRSFNPQTIQIILNRSKTKRELQNLPEGNTIDLMTNGHSVSITKICNDKNDVDNKKYHYIVVDSNGPSSVICDSSETKSAEDKLCDIIEIISNKYLRFEKDNYKPYIQYGNSTKINEEVRKCLKKVGYESENITFSLYKKLISAAQKGDLDGVKEALKLGANVNAAGNNGWTPLHTASYRGHLEVVEELMKHGT